MVSTFGYRVSNVAFTEKRLMLCLMSIVKIVFGGILLHVGNCIQL